jgi:hypothetical protein
MRKAICGAAAALLMAGGLGLVAAAQPASAQSGNGSMGVYQVGLSFNCDKGSCDQGEGGFWGWWEFDSPQNSSTAGSGGDGQAAFCGHGGGFSGAGHAVYDIHDWYVAPDPQNNDLPTFFASWTETDSFRGQTETSEWVDQSTGIPAFTVHRPLLELFGVPTPPGTSMNVQVDWKPAN